MTKKECRKLPCICCGGFDKVTVDHVKPKALGGDISWKQPLCFKCNQAKGILTIDYNTKTLHLESWMLKLTRKDFKRLMTKTHSFSCDFLNPMTKTYKRYHEV